MFIPLHWDGEKIGKPVIMAIDPSIDPGDYPRVLASLAFKHISGLEEGEMAPVAYLLQVEAFSLSQPLDDAPDEEKKAFEEARKNRSFSKHPDSKEQVVAMVADIYGRYWQAQRCRGDDTITEEFHALGDAPRGRLTSGLMSVAAATGITCHGLNFGGGLN